MRLADNHASIKNGRSPAVVCHLTLHPAFETRIFQKECVSLASAGYLVHVIGPHTRDETARGIHMHAVPPSTSRKHKLLVTPLQILRKALTLRPRPVIFHFHDPALVPVGVILRILTRAVVIYDVHENVSGQILTKYWIPLGLRWLISTAYRVMEGLATIGMGIIESDMIEGRYRQPKQSIRNLPWVDREHTAPRTLGDFQGPPRFIYAGGITPERGAFTMLKLAGALRDRGLAFEMTLVGNPSPPGLVGQMRQFIEEHKLQSNIKLLGLVKYAESLELIRAATIGLSLLEPIPNYRFALPTKILEYMTYGLGVISSPLPCSERYVMGAKVGILVDGGDIEEMATRVMAFATDAERLLECSRNGQKAIAQELNWQKESELLLQFYQRMLGQTLEHGKCSPHQFRSDVE